MKVTLKVNDDAEMRAHLKELITNQINAMGREEIKGIFEAEMVRKIKLLNNGKMEDYIMDLVRKVIKDAFSAGSVQATLNSEIIAPIIHERVTAALAVKNWDKVIDEAASLKLRRMIEKQEQV